MNRHQRRAAKYANTGKHSLGRQPKQKKAKSTFAKYVQRKQAEFNQRVKDYFQSEYYAVLHGENGG